MNFGFSEEQEELRKMVKRFLEEKSPESEVRRLMATAEGYDTAVWDQMAKELALQGLGIPEEFGGQGYGPVELYVVFEEMGAALFCCAVFLDRRARRQRGALRRHRGGQGGLPAGHRLGRDDRHGRLTDDAGLWDLTKTSTTASASGDGFVVNGVRSYVTDGNTSSIIFVPAMTAKGLSLFAVEGDAKGVARESLATMDQTRKQSRIVFSDAPATLVGVEGEALAGLETTLQVAAAALAAEQVGGRAARAQQLRRVRQEPRAVRSTDRIVPGDQAQVRRHALGRRVGQVRRVLRRLGRPGAQRRTGDRREPGEVVLLRGLLPLRGGEHPDSRRHRFHLGAPRAPVLQARQEFGALLGRPGLPPRTSGSAPRHLARCSPTSNSRAARRCWTFASPPRARGRSASHALIVVHGLPRAMGMGRQAAGLLPELAEHLANESGWIVATGTLSGVGGSTGTFSRDPVASRPADDPRTRRRGGASDLDGRLRLRRGARIGDRRRRRADPRRGDVRHAGPLGAVVRQRRGLPSRGADRRRRR